jgi:choline-sulfatase
VGFEVYDDATDAVTGSNASASLPERRGDHTIDRALAWLNSHSGTPFFLWVHLYDPHSPYRPPEPFHSRYASHLYDGEIAFDDAQVGRLVTNLRGLGVYDGTLIAIAGDHGEGLGEHNEAEHSFLVYDSTLRVPLILKMPGPAARASVVNEPVGLVDLAPAIAQVCGIRPASTAAFQGRSLLSLVESKEKNTSLGVYAESYYARSAFGWHELRALITPQYKYIDAPGKELYDLKDDPGEMRNLVITRSKVAASLREALDGLASRYENIRAAQSPAQLDSDALSKLRSLGYLAHQAPAGRGSHLNSADPKDKIKGFNQLLRAENLSSVHRFAEAEDVFKDLERSEPDLYIVSFERGENLLNWGKAQAAMGEIQKALTLNPSFDQAWAAMGRAEFALGENKRAADALQAALRLREQFAEFVAFLKAATRMFLVSRAGRY